MPIVFQTDEGNADGAAIVALAGAAGLCVTVLALGVAVLIIAGVWKMFVKAGRPGWAAVVPFYGDMVRNEIAGVPVVWTYYLGVVYVLSIFTGGLFGLAPVVILALNYFTYGPLLKAYGRNNDTASVIIALLFPFVIFPQIGFNNAVTYSGPDATAVAALPTLPWIDNAGAGTPPAAPPSAPTNTSVPTMKGTADDDLNKPQQ